MKFRSIKTLLAGFFLSINLTASVANAGLITKDYASLGDGLLTIDTVAKKEWLDVSMFVGMNFKTLLGTNQWTQDGFSLASTGELFQLFINAGLYRVSDYPSSRNFCCNRNGDHVKASRDLAEKLGVNSAAFTFAGLMGIYKDENGNGNSYLAMLRTHHGDAMLGINGDRYGEKVSTNGQAGAFFVRDVQDTPDFTKVPEPSSLAILALGVLGLASRRFKKNIGSDVPKEHYLTQSN